MEKVNNLTLDQWIEKETQEKTVEFWGEKYTFTPELCDTVIGDGKQLVYLGTISQRPYYWLIRIDSSTNVSSDEFDFEDILLPLEDCFDRPDSEDEDEECEYPVINWSGGHWGMVVNMVSGELW